MKVVLIRPPRIRGAIEKVLIQQPINLAYIASYLMGSGYEVEVWDYEVQKLEPNSLNRQLQLANPKAIGITCMTPTVNNAHNVATLIKRYNPDIKIVLGGPHASALPQRTLLEFASFDAVVIGEGEITFKEVCQKIEAGESLKGVRGIAYRENGDIKIEEKRSNIENLDSLPYPARNILNRNLYYGIPSFGLNYDFQNKTEIFTSRGCLYRCSFCTISNTLGPKIRFRTVENVIGEIEQCKNQYGYNHIGFEDPNFTSDTKRLQDICQGLKEINVTWNCQTRVDMVNREILRMMADCGCKKIAYGVESGSPRILKLIHKDINPSQIISAFRWSKEFGILTCAFLMVGSHPSETKEDIEMTKDLIKRIQPDVFQLTIAVPYPGSELYNIMKNRDYLEEEDWTKFNFMHSLPKWHTEYFSPKQLVQIQKSIYLSYYISNLGLIPHLIKEKISWSKIVYWFNLFKGVSKFLFFEKRN